LTGLCHLYFDYTISCITAEKASYYDTVTVRNYVGHIKMQKRATQKKTPQQKHNHITGSHNLPSMRDWCHIFARCCQKQYSL